MDWSNEYFIPLYNALLVPIIIFGVGLIVEWIGNFLTGILGMVFGRRIAFFVRNRLTFVGTVHHELAHAFFAWISGAKVTKIELFHVRGEQLGCVEFYPRGNAFTKAIQMTLSSIAPVICGAVSLCALFWLWKYYCVHMWHFVLAGYFMISIFFHMNMSSQDIKNAWKGMPLTMLICYIIFFITKINFITLPISR